jgi:AcrR family transcriptional regulator
VPGANRFPITHPKTGSVRYWTVLPKVVIVRRVSPVWSAREAQLLAITLRLLQEHGYDRLTVDAVACQARASKATVYRRWPSKAELVLAAFIEGVSAVAAPTLRAVLTELSRNPALGDALQHQFIDQRKELITAVLSEAVTRGEIDAGVISDELWDVLPAYLVFRSLISDRPPTDETVQSLVDDVLMPSLTRTVRHTV